MFTELSTTINKKLHKAGLHDQKNVNIMAFCFFMMCLVVQLDIQHLVLAIIGAGTYGLLQMRLRRDQAPPKKVWTDCDDEKPRRAPLRPYGIRAPSRRDDDQQRKQQHQPKSNKVPVTRVENNPTKAFGPPAATTSAMPLSAPIFTAQGWDGEVVELLEQLKPSLASQEAVQKLVAIAKQAIHTVLPWAEVFGFACGDIARGSAFGVAVPEVEILVRCSPEMLARGLRVRLQKAAGAASIEERKLQKSAIRACTDLLVTAGFKFRRSAFRGEEPKVTLLAPSTLGVLDKAVPVDFSVNTATPVYNSALMSVASAIDPRVLELGLLVKRWVKDRGVCHVAKGHLSPYAWNLLTIYFFQCLGNKEGKDGMLPVFDKFDWSGSPVGNKRACISQTQEPSWVVPEEFAGLTAPQLLKEFFHFYRYAIDWSQEGVSLHHTRNSKAASSLPKRMKAAVIQPPANEPSVYVPEFTFGEPAQALAIEDPWEPTRNLSANCTYFGVVRMKEELCRACNLCAENESLSKLLEPWVPPERPDAKGSDDESPDAIKTNPQTKSQAGNQSRDTVQATDALGAALFTELKNRGERQARKATEQLIEQLRAEDTPGGREKKTRELLSLLQDDQKLSEMLATKPLL